MSGQVSRGSAGEYQTDERAGVGSLRWRVSGRNYMICELYLNKAVIKKVTREKVYCKMKTDKNQSYLS